MIRVILCSPTPSSSFGIIDFFIDNIISIDRVNSGSSLDSFHRSFDVLFQDCIPCTVEVFICVSTIQFFHPPRLLIVPDENVISEGLMSICCILEQLSTITEVKHSSLSLDIHGFTGISSHSDAHFTLVDLSVSLVSLHTISFELRSYKEAVCFAQSS